MCKGVVPRWFYQFSQGRVPIAMANHGIDYDLGQQIAYREIGETLHLPIRSVARCVRKAIVGALATCAIPDRLPEDCTHWFAMAREIAEDHLTEDRVRGVAATTTRRHPPGHLSQLPACCRRGSRNAACRPPDRRPGQPSRQARRHKFGIGWTASARR